jgi:hypothetical protein
MTLQISALRTDDLEENLAARIERRLTALADDLEHAEVVVYDADRGLATRGGVLRMTLADLAAIVAEVVVEARAGAVPGPAVAGVAAIGTATPPVGRHVAR